MFSLELCDAIKLRYKSKWKIASISTSWIKLTNKYDKKYYHYLSKKNSHSYKR